MMRATRCSVAWFAVLTFGVALTGCGSDGPEEVDGLPTVDGAPELLVTATDFRFAPSRIEVVAGEPLNVVLEVTQGGHDLGVEGADFLLPIVDDGEVTRGALVVAEPGTYRLVCTVPGHVAEGMVGEVVVVAPGGG